MSELCCIAAWSPPDGGPSHIVLWLRFTTTYYASYSVMAVCKLFVAVVTTVL